MAEAGTGQGPSGFDRAVRLVALLGGVLLIALATAVAAFCFLPWCQLRRGNIFVDTFTLKLPERLQRRIDAAWDVVYGLAMALIAWRLGVGARAAFASGENTMVLQLPSYLPIALCAVLAALVCVTAFVSASRLLRAGG